MEKLETRVAGSVLRDDDGLAMLGDPARDSLANPNLEPVDHFVVRILGSAEYQFVILDNVDKAGIALDEFGCKLNDMLKDFVERIGRGHAAADPVQGLDVEITVDRTGAHAST